jgi:uncharacterized caspase-like protein
VRGASLFERVAHCAAAALICSSTAHALDPNVEFVRTVRGTDSSTVRRVALVVGVNTYEDAAITPLLFAVDDAEAIEEQLGDDSVGDFDTIEVLTDERASRDAFWEALETVSARLRPRDVFLIYFSGHGTVEFVDGSSQLYLLPYDGSMEDPQSSAISLTELTERLGELSVKRRVVIVDACHTIGGRSALTEQAQAAIKGGATVDAPADYPDVSESEVRLFSSAFRQPSREDPELRHGIFTWYLLEGLSGVADLDGDDLVEVEEAHDYAMRATEARTGRQQQPRIELVKVGRAEIYLAGDPRKRRARENEAPAYLVNPSDMPVQVNGVKGGAGPMQPDRYRFEVELEGLTVEQHRRLRPGSTFEIEPWARTRLQRTLWGVGVDRSAGLCTRYVTTDTALRLGYQRLPADGQGVRASWAVALGYDVGSCLMEGAPILDGMRAAGDVAGGAGLLWGHHWSVGPRLDAAVRWRLSDDAVPLQTSPSLRPGVQALWQGETWFAAITPRLELALLGGDQPLLLAPAASASFGVVR